MLRLTDQADDTVNIIPLLMLIPEHSRLTHIRTQQNVKLPKIRASMTQDSRMLVTFHGYVVDMLTCSRCIREYR